MRMPRYVRNFWVEATVDGRKTPVRFGPRAKDGGFRMTIYMRSEGAPVEALIIEGKALEDDKMLLMVDTTWAGPMQITARRG